MNLDTEMPSRGRLSLFGEAVTVHFIEQSFAFGADISLEGSIFVERADGVLHRIKGAELAELCGRYPAFRRICREWRLPS